MKVLMISGDKNMLVHGTEAYGRLELQCEQVDQLDVFVWPQVHSWHDIWVATKTNAYDVITAQDPFWRGLLAWKIARMMGSKLNVQVHTDLAAQSLMRSVLARFILRRADSVRAVSEKIKKQIEQMNVRAQVRVLPIFVDTERLKKLTPQPHAQKTILWIGRFEKEKNPLYAVTVLKEVRAKGVDAKLVMLGTGSLESVLRSFAKGLPVEFPGWQDPVHFMALADVVLSTSRHESYGASIIEALAAGVPVVAPDVGVAREAGAIVVPKSDFGNSVSDVLISGTKGELRLLLPNREEWAKRWRETLV